MSKPLSTDPYRILLGHNRWANAELLTRCKALSDEEFHRRFEIGPGSLHDTLAHVIGATFRWADRIGGRELRASIEGRKPDDSAASMTKRTPSELLVLNDQASADFDKVVAEVCASGAINDVREWKFGDETYTFGVAAAILHLTNHSMHHRAQCMNMLRHLGHPVNADLDELEWQIAGEP